MGGCAITMSPQGAAGQPFDPARYPAFWLVRHRVRPDGPVLSHPGPRDAATSHPTLQPRKSRRAGTAGGLGHKAHPSRAGGQPPREAASRRLSCGFDSAQAAELPSFTRARVAPEVGHAASLLDHGGGARATKTLLPSLAWPWQDLAFQAGHFCPGASGSASTSISTQGQAGFASARPRATWRWRRRTAASSVTFTSDSLARGSDAPAPAR